ncbi:hypothetical protein AB1K70_03400 [Bremerella sp. JC770]|uniref:hypothetical protein n=1 Tax=Bremerella sp. JC770 TaxID=3232137 RepID=UPI003457F2D1
MANIEQVTGEYIDGNFDSSDIQPMFDLISLVTSVAEDMLDWYDDSTDSLEEGNDWLVWLSGATSQSRSFSDKDLAERTEFTEWMDEIDFDYQTYFNRSNGVVTSIKGDYEVSEVVELLTLEVENVSSQAEQVSLFTNALIGDLADGNSELMNMLDTIRATAKGHIR